MKKIKVFLGGVVNVSNAQNNNCRSLIEYLDDKKFEVFSLQSMREDRFIIKGAKFFIIPQPIKIFKYLAFAWGIMRCDIAYLPKTECMTWNRFLCKIFSKKYFRTIESILDINDGKVPAKIVDYKKTDNLYSITGFMKKYNLDKCGIESHDKIMYLGVDEKKDIKIRNKTQLKNTVLIGHDLKRKGIHDYLKLAKSHPDIKFHIIGSGNNKVDVEKLVSTHNQENNIENIVFHGSLSSEQVEHVIENNDIDLLVLPSHSEGFPKVILECARFGIPSLLYSTYGAKEWIDHDSNGFVCDTLEEMSDKVDELIRNPRLLCDVGSQSVNLYEEFKWSSKVKDWEEEMIKIWRS